MDLWMQYLIYFLLLMLIFLGIRFLWISIRHRIFHPEQWIYEAKHGRIPSEIQKAEKSEDDKVKLYNFWFQIKRITADDVRGDFAELGVYKGDSAWLIHQLAPARVLHLFDTFSGFRPSDLSGETGDAAAYSWSDFADTDLETVKARLGNVTEIQYHEGWFPDSSAGLEDIRYAFVHIDADLYQPVSAGLSYFYPRLSPGGVILIHDYTHKWEGLMRAVDEFVRTIPETLVHVPDRFGTVMILKNRVVEP